MGWGARKGSRKKTLVFNVRVFKMFVLFHKVMKDKLDTNKLILECFHFTINLDYSK